MIVPPTVDQAPKMSWGLFYFAVKLTQIIFTYPIDNSLATAIIDRYFRFYRRSIIAVAEELSIGYLGITWDNLTAK